MVKHVLKELIPINLINFMIIAGIQYYRTALRQPASNTDILIVGPAGMSGLHPFWVLPVAAGILYIAMTILQFFDDRLFVPKTLLVFGLGNLHVALLCRELGELDSVASGMAPSALAAALCLIVIGFRKSFMRIRGKPGD